MDFTTYEPRIQELEAGGSGGGGSSDFSTAQVTFINYASRFTVSIPNIAEGEMFGNVSEEVVAEPIEALLYKGKTYAVLVSGEAQFSTVEGNATKENDYVIDIMGDCTITINGLSN